MVMAVESFCYSASIKYFWVKVALTGMFITSQLLAQSPGDTIAWWAFNENGGNNTKETFSGNSFSIAGNLGPTEWLSGVQGHALRLNGYESWVEGETSLSFPQDQLTFTTWIAIESWPVGNAAIFARFDPSTQKGLMVGATKYGKLFVSVRTNQQFHNFSSQNKVPRFTWVHIAVTIDLTTGKLKAFINGSLEIDGNLNGSMIDWPASDSLFIGRHPDQNLVGLFDTNVLNSMIDEMALYKKAFSESEISTIFAQQQPVSQPILAIPKSRFSKDFHRPQFHAMPPAAWANEPHGFILHQGVYHIFYQKNANGPYWSHINWGHQTSNDLIRWEEQKPILSPEQGFDQQGIWSGTCVINDNGTPTIMYTGVDGFKAGMGLAIGNADMSEWQKYAGNPVISSPPAAHPNRDFRDPFIWKQGADWYMIIGSGLVSTGLGGTVFLYKSQDLTNWTFLRPLKTGIPANDDSGIFWEMPMLINFGEKDVLVVNKVPEPGKLAKTLYWIGKFENERFFPDFENPKNLEITNALLAPTITRDSSGQVIAVGIIPDERAPEANFKAGWAHTFSLPRTWTLSDDKSTLLQRPHPNLNQLRKSLTRFENLSIAEGQSNLLPGVSGNQLKIKAAFQPGNALRVGLVIGKSLDGTEQTRIFYDYLTGVFAVDRNNSSTNPEVNRDVRFGKYPISLGTGFEIEVYIDGSVVEVFVNNEAAFATRIFPTDSMSNHVDLFAENGTATANYVDIWEMRSMNDPTVGLDNRLADIQPEVNFFPNPFSDSFSIKAKLKLAGESRWYLTDLQGRIIHEEYLGFHTAGEFSQDWNGLLSSGRSLPKGVYMGIFEVIGQGRIVCKIIKY